MSFATKLVDFGRLDCMKIAERQTENGPNFCFYGVCLAAKPFETALSLIDKNTPVMMFEECLY